MSGDGDWRRAGLPARSAEFSHPLRAVVGGGETAGGLPHFGSLFEVEPAGAVQLAALKAAGQSIASGSGQHVDPSEGVAVRLVETSGLRRTSRSGPGYAGSRRLRADLLEQPRLQSMATDGLTLHGVEIATVLTRLNQPKLLDADHVMLAPDAEAAQPLYARYWLHNRGPAPLGGLPAVAHLHPQHPSGRDPHSADPNSQLLLRLTAASDCSDAALHGRVRLVCPTAGPPTRPICRSCCRPASIWRPTSSWPSRRRRRPGCTRCAPSWPSPEATRPPCPPRGGKWSRTSASCPSAIPPTSPCCA